jgi:hypothetical protein
MFKNRAIGSSLARCIECDDASRLVVDRPMHG